MLWPSAIAEGAALCLAIRSCFLSDPESLPMCGPYLYIHGEARYYSIVFFLTVALIVVLLSRSPGSSIAVPSVQVSPPRGILDLSMSDTFVPGRFIHLLLSLLKHVLMIGVFGLSYGVFLRPVRCMRI